MCVFLATTRSAALGCIPNQGFFSTETEMTRNVQISSSGIEPSHLKVECLLSLVLGDTGGLHYGGYYTLAIPPQASSQTLPHGRSDCQKSPLPLLTSLTTHIGVRSIVTEAKRSKPQLP